MILNDREELATVHGEVRVVGWDSVFSCSLLALPGILESLCDDWILRTGLAYDPDDSN